MPNTAAEAIQVGALTVRFHVDADDSGGSVSVFESKESCVGRLPFNLRSGPKDDR